MACAPSWIAPKSKYLGSRVQNMSSVTVTECLAKHRFSASDANKMLTVGDVMYLLYFSVMQQIFA